MCSFLKSLNGPISRPYYIESLDYDRKFAGIRAMHLLCHALNLVGEEAYVYTKKVDCRLRTPILTREIIENHEKSERKPIVIYPEVVNGNPREVKSVVRYILNHPGILGGPKHFDNNELVYFFNYDLSILLSYLPKNILHIPITDRLIFHNRNNNYDSSRSGTLIYAGRYLEGIKSHAHLFKKSTLITSNFPQTQKELADLFQRSELTYCLTNSAIATESALCGCPVVFLNTPYTEKFIEFYKNCFSHGKPLPYGMALGDSEDEIARAKQTLKQFCSSYDQLELKFWEQLQGFIDQTQEMAVQDYPRDVPHNKKLINISVNSAGLKKVVNDIEFNLDERASYHKWLNKHNPSEAEFKIIRERTETSIPPNILILVVLESHEYAFLADTIDSLSQQIYENWTLAILSQESCPDPAIDEMEMIHWLQVDGISYQAINSILAQLSFFDWVAIVPAGSRLAPHALSICANYTHLHPDWCFLYSDEDFIDSKQKRFDPIFKPDFNLDLLRSSNYIGDFCLAKKNVVNNLEGYNQLAHVLNWDLCLKIFESLGEKAIGHIPEILFHRPVKNFAKEEKEYLTVASKLVLQAHFDRLGEKAAIGAGLLENTFFIDYPISAQPLISIVVTIVNTDQLNLLGQCIESLRSNTQYPNYEIIISSLLPDLEVCGILGSEIDGVHLKYMPYDGELASPLSNRILHDVNGELVLLFSPDLLVLHNYWLEVLIAQALRPEVGVVGVRIVDNAKKIYHAGIVLGMDDLGVAGYPNRDLPMDQPGYMKRAAVVQDLSAVSTLCFLVKKDLLKNALVFKSSVFDHIDFCLKVRQKGYLIVWTPFVTVQLIKQVLQKRSMTDLRKDADTVIANWLPLLANDPAYNRNLSLKHRHFQVETETDVTWNPDFHDRLRVYAFPANDSGVGEYRVRSPLRALTNAVMIQSSLLPNHSATLIPDIVEIERVKPDVLLLQNGTADYLINAWEQYKRFNSVFRIYSQDDLVFALPGKHPLQAKWPKDMRKRLRKLMENSDRLIVANEPLKEAYSRWIDDIKIVPNYLESTRWLNLPTNQKQRSGNKLRVGWAGGAQHHGDLEFIIPVVESLKDEVDWIFMGMCPDRLKPIIKEYHGGVPFDLYPQKLAELDLDLAIAPLEYNNFNTAKTNLRILEYGVLGWSVICSDILPYQNAPVTLVGNNTQYWLKVIREKISEPEALRAEGKILQQWVLDNYLLDDHLDDWLQALTP